MKLCEELGYIEKGTGKHQSNTVYGGGGVAPCLCAAAGVKYGCFLYLEKQKEKERIHSDK